MFYPCRIDCGFGMHRVEAETVLLRFSNKFHTTYIVGTRARMQYRRVLSIERTVGCYPVERVLVADCAPARFEQVPLHLHRRYACRGRGRVNKGTVYGKGK